MGRSRVTQFVIVCLVLCIIALTVFLLVAAHQLISSNAALVRAVLAKDLRELAMANRAENRPPAPAVEAPETLSRSELAARIARDIDAVEGVLDTRQPVGFDGN